MRIAKIFFSIFILSGFVISGGFILAQEDITTTTASVEPLVVSFFYSNQCQHCQAEQKFLDKIEKNYPQITINRYLYNDPSNKQILLDTARRYKAEKYVGLVPLTFLDDDFFLGFDSEEKIGRQIEKSIQDYLANNSSSSDSNIIAVPFLGPLSLGKYSLALTSILLGGFDGFNVCSLGALVLILGLVLAMKSRVRIAIFGGAFVATTAIAYGVLIILWYRVFSYFVGYLWIVDIALAALGIGGGIYFLLQFLKSRKASLVCEKKPGGIVHKASFKLQSIFENPQHILLTLLGVLLFALIVAVVEFPCSAVVPVAYAGFLAKSDLPALSYIFYIALYILFYMLDEILVLIIAIATMKLWIASNKFTKWAVLGESIVLFALGIYYFLSII